MIYVLSATTKKVSLFYRRDVLERDHPLLITGITPELQAGTVFGSGGGRELDSVQLGLEAFFRSTGTQFTHGGEIFVKRCIGVPSPYLPPWTVPKWCRSLRAIWPTGEMCAFRLNPSGRYTGGRVPTAFGAP